MNDEQNATGMPDPETKPVGEVLKASLASVVNAAESNQDGFLTKVLTQLGTLSSASVLIATVAKIFNASDFQVSLLGISCLVILYMIVYRRKVDRIVPASGIFIVVILILTAAGWEKERA